MDGHTVSPFDLSQTLPVGGGLLVPFSFPGSPVIKQLMQMVTVVPGQGGRFWSVFPPISVICLVLEASTGWSLAGTDSFLPALVGNTMFMSMGGLLFRGGWWDRQESAQ